MKTSQKSVERAEIDIARSEINNYFVSSLLQYSFYSLAL